MCDTALKAVTPNAKDFYESEYFSTDDFLYCRCVMLINGRTYYNAVLNKMKKLRKNMACESLLYAPAKALKGYQ
ncbi:MULTISPECIES: DUF4240 domain-containing protein [Caproicibacterium]|uniref:DUF4240 domain-containing protein n=1 Tax=Caproicibacterium TaxID=2834348 RepID=UPI0038990B18